MLRGNLCRPYLRAEASIVVSVKLRLKSLKGFSPGAELDVIAGVNSHYPALLGPEHPELLLTKGGSRRTRPVSA